MALDTPTRVIEATVVTEPISVDRILERARTDRDGAVILFLGTVRDHNDGRPVSGMEYEAYAEMAAEEFRRILEEAVEESGVTSVLAAHRIGELGIGEVSLAIAVGSPHRDEAYRVSRVVIEAVKKRLPVWKKEHYIDGNAAWLPGTDPREASA